MGSHYKFEVGYRGLMSDVGYGKFKALEWVLIISLRCVKEGLCKVLGSGVMTILVERAWGF